MAPWHWDQVKMDHIDNKYAWIEQLIRSVSYGMQMEVPEDELVQMLKDYKVDDSDIFLIMKAAELLYKDRTQAPLKKTAFKRV